MSSVDEIRDIRSSKPDENAFRLRKCIRDHLDESTGKSGGEYDLTGGRVFLAEDDFSILRFTMPECPYFLEDVPGRLFTADESYGATVRWQDAGRVFIEVQCGPDTLPSRLTEARYTVNRAASLERLLSVLEEIGPEAVHSGSAAAVLQGIHERDIEWADVRPEALPEILDRHSLVFLNTPPGSNWAKAAARTVASCVENGRRVIVGSATNRGLDRVIDQVLSQPAISAAGGGLSMRRAGWSPCSEFRAESLAGRPEADVHLKDEERKSAILGELEGIERAMRETEKALGRREHLEALRRDRGALEGRFRDGGRILEEKTATLNEVKTLWEKSRARVERAKAAWIGLPSRRRRAILNFREITGRLARAEEEVGRTRAEYEAVARRILDIDREMPELATDEPDPPDTDGLREELASLSSKWAVLMEELRHLESPEEATDAAPIAPDLLFGTLSELIDGAGSDGPPYDTVVIVEAESCLSPAVVPVLSLADGQALIIGDWMGLDPRPLEDVNGLRWPADGESDGAFQSLEDSVTWASLSVQDRMAPDIAGLVRDLIPPDLGVVPEDDPSLPDRQMPGWLHFLPPNPLIVADTAPRPSWCGKESGTLERFNLGSADTAMTVAAKAATEVGGGRSGDSPDIYVVTLSRVQAGLMNDMALSLGLEDRVACGPPGTFIGGEAEMVVFDPVLDDPLASAKLTVPRWSKVMRKELAGITGLCRDKFVFIGSTDWMARPPATSAAGRLWKRLQDRGDMAPASRFAADGQPGGPGMLAEDLNQAERCVFGLVTADGGAWWSAVKAPLIHAIERGVEVFLLWAASDFPLGSAWCAAADDIRGMGGTVCPAEGLAGLEFIIDEETVYIGRGEANGNAGPVFSRYPSAPLAQRYLKLLQADRIRTRLVDETGRPRQCPICGSALMLVNQGRQKSPKDVQPLKVCCTNADCGGYIRPLDERPPFREPPICPRDGLTPYHRAGRGRKQAWRCPLHPDECPEEKVVPGDPS